MSETNLPQPVPAKFERIEEFIEAYANNVRFESTVVDLKLIFGQSDLHTGSEVVEQHTAITVPWALAKMMIYYLAVNVIAQESQNGQITIPPIHLPPAIEPPTDEQSKQLIDAEKLHAQLKDLRDRFLSGKII